MKLFCFAAVFFALAWPLSARAACGLQGCTIERHRAVEKRRPLGMLEAAMLGGSYGTGSGMEETQAAYWTTTFHAMVTPAPRFRGAVTLPVGLVVREDAQGTREHFGPGNLMLEAAVIPLLWAQGKSMVWVGSQFEFPTGDAEKGLGSGHYETLPFAALHMTFGPSVTYLQAGGRIAMAEGGDSHGHGAAPGSLLDPHSGREAVYRVGFLHHFNRRCSGGLSLAGQTVLAARGRGDTFLSLVPEGVVHFSDALSLNLRVEAPVSPDRRFDWRLGAGASYLF